LVAVADYILNNKRGAVVSNLSSSRALGDVAEKHGCTYHASAVGEVNVVAEMKRTQAVIGGEGNGGIIFPALHYGRDALVGIALFLSHLATFGGKISQLRKTYPNYHMVKDKLELSAEKLLHCLEQLKVHAFQNNYEINTTDGIKISYESEQKWIHIRPSNTEPIVRLYTEAPTLTEARALVDEYKTLLSSFIDV
jgi:phosphomannomutase